MDDSVRVIMGTGILSIGDSFYEVEAWTDSTKLKKGKGYMKGSYVYIYRGKYKKDSTEPGIYKSDDEYIIKEPKGKEKELYHVNNIKEIDITNIFEQIDEHSEDFISVEDVEIINNNAEIYIPTIKEDDDFLKLAVKKAIMAKEINLLNYKNNFNSQYTLNNMKSSLNRETKMTVPKFKLWCEILGVGFELRIFDNNTDPRNPLKEDIIIRSDDPFNE